MRPGWRDARDLVAPHARRLDRHAHIAEIDEWCAGRDLREARGPNRATSAFCDNALPQHECERDANNQ